LLAKSKAQECDKHSEKLEENDEPQDTSNQALDHDVHTINDDDELGENKMVTRLKQEEMFRCKMFRVEPRPFLERPQSPIGPRAGWFRRRRSNPPSGLARVIEDPEEPVSDSDTLIIY
jgi:hypothetical protein